MPAKSIANVPFRIGDFSFEAKVCELVQPVKVDTREICAKHGKPVDYDQRCAKCLHRLKAPAVGTPAPPPLKERFCSNQECGINVAGKVINKAYCDDCEAIIKGDQIEDGYCSGGKLLRLTQEEVKALKALRQPKGVHVFAAAPTKQLLTVMRYVRATYQLLPGTKANADLAFEMFRSAAIYQDRIFLAHVVLKDEAKHLQFEYDNGGIVSVDPDGLVVLTLLHAMHEVQPEVQPAQILPLPVLERMAALQRLMERPFAKQPEAEVMATQGTRALHGLLAAKAKGEPFTVPQPVTISHEMAALASALSGELKAALPSRRRGNGKSSAKGSSTEAGAAATDAAASKA